MTTRTDSTFARLRGALASAGVLVVAALLVAPFALPAASSGARAQETAETAVAEAADGAEAGGLEAQSLRVGAQAVMSAVATSDYGVTSYAQALRERYGNSRAGVGGLCGDEVCWPFPYAVPMTDGFGPRAAPCAGCSTNHRGIDLLPGAGTPIYAVADGVVSGSQEGWSYGTHLFIEHTIDGQRVTSLYAHMQTGSSPLRVGDQISVGDFVGLVGSTGASTAPHLHLEIRIEGTAIDPLPWLRKYTGTG